MVDKMYTVEKIENNIVILEDRENNTFLEIKKEILPEIKEGDILELIDGKYILNEEYTKKIKENIRNKFNSLMN